MSDRIYKILTLRQWEGFARSARFIGSEHDQRDGFIHLCSGPQLPGTLNKHYKDIKDVFLIGFETRQFGEELRWEVSRGGEKFPHVYDELSFSTLVSVHRLAQSHAGGYDLPSGL